MSTKGGLKTIFSGNILIVNVLFEYMVRVEGLEPPRLAAPEPKSGASTNFATPAFKIQIVFHIPLSKGYSGFESKNEFFKKILF